MTTPPYPLHPEPMKKTWLERNPLWKIPLGCLTLFVLLAGLRHYPHDGYYFVFPP